MAVRTERASDRILACLQRAPGLTGQQLAGRLNISPSTVAALLALLYKEGVVDRSPNGSGEGSDGAWRYFLRKSHPQTT